MSYILWQKKPVRPLKFKFKFNQNCQTVHNNPQYESRSMDLKKAVRPVTMELALRWEMLV